MAVAAPLLKVGRSSAAPRARRSQNILELTSGAQTQTPLILVESVMHTADARALDEATVSALRRSVYAP
ncbi:hypothetical protein DFH06DRAFT_1474754 [Mycena polygramma]|nr:hypothetical protein DFH06DRAFT_1474754 [Mycena polygramma]